MAFPQVSSSNGGVTASGASHTVTLPTPIASGELLLALVACGHNVAVTWDNSTAGTWTPEFDVLDSGGQVRFVGYSKIADGTEDSANLSITTDNTVLTAWQTFAISGWHGTSAPEVSTSDQGATTSPDPPSLSPSWGAEDTLWLTSIGADAQGTVLDITAYPTNYTDGAQQRSGGTRGSLIGTARREMNAASEDPGTFTTDTLEEIIAVTIAIRPAGGGGGSTAVPVFRHHYMVMKRH